MTSFSQGVQSPSKLLLDQHVVRIVGRDGEDGHAIVREWFDEGKQNSSLREGERTFKFQANPALAGIDDLWEVRGGTDNREFISGAGDRGEVRFCGQVGDERKVRRVGGI